MRVVYLLVFLFSGLALPVRAQADLSLYRVEEVAVGVSAQSAAQARDEAIVQAQRQAFTMLAARLGADGAGEGLDDDSLGGMVQAFEVMKEHASSGRYTGTFAVQFKPSAVRAFLDRKGKDYTETQSRPFVVLPVVSVQGRDLLWEEATLWREAWEAVSKTPGLVPLIVPAGDLDDIATISAKEALEGVQENLQAIAGKYGAAGVVVALLKTGADTHGSISAVRHDFGGQAYAPLVFSLPEEETPDILKDSAKKIVAELGAKWKEKIRENGATGQVSVVPVDVPVPTLASWAQIKSRLTGVPLILRANIVTMTRGLVHIELAFQGDLPSLQEALAQEDLVLEETQPGHWELREDI